MRFRSIHRSRPPRTARANRPRRRRLPALLGRYATSLALLGTLTLGGCTAPEARSDDTVTVAASTPIIADLVGNVAGTRAQTTSIVPFGADPHTYEPSLAALKDIARADVVFSNGLLLESQALTNTIDANLPKGTQNITLGDAAVAYGARHIALVEDASLATVWLGFRVEDDAAAAASHGGTDPQADTADAADGADAADAADTAEAAARKQKSSVTLTTSAEGPGQLSAFTTGTFGQPTAWIVSDRKASENEIELPLNAHTHMSWGFSAPGIYTMHLQAHLNEPGQEPRPLGETDVTFAVGVDPAQTGREHQIDSGHVDITAYTSGALDFRGEVGTKQTTRWGTDESVVVVPHSAATTVPGDPSWNFLGHPGSEAWVLAQAVVGKHVHGDIDPHMWLDISNAIAYVEVIRTELSRVDPAGAPEYEANAAAYIEQLSALDEWSAGVISSIPKANRKLVTTHDGFGYLADAYHLQVAGFVAPNPTAEPSAQALANLTRTLIDLHVPAVFAEPGSRAHRGELEAAAQAANAQVCELVSDTLTEQAHSYVALVETNTQTLKSCLDPGALPAWPPDYATPQPGSTA